MRTLPWLMLAAALAGCDGGEPDFALVPPAGTVTLVSGQIGMIEFEVERSGGFDATVVVSASGLRAGITPSAVPVSAELDGGILQLSVETSAELGPIDGAFLVGIAGDLERTAPVALTVVAP